MKLLTADGKTEARDVEEVRLYAMLRHWTSIRCVHRALNKEGKGITHQFLAKLQARKLDKFELSKEIRKILGCKEAVRVIAQVIANEPRNNTSFLEAKQGLSELFAEMKERVHAGQAGVILP